MYDARQKKYARVVHVTVGVDPGVALGLQHEATQAQANARSATAQAYATQAQTAQAETHLKVAAQESHNAIVAGLKAQHAREVGDLRAEARVLRDGLQKEVQTLQARLAGAEEQCSGLSREQVADADRVAHEKARGDEAERSARDAAAQTEEHVAHIQKCMQQLASDRKAYNECVATIDRMRKEKLSSKRASGRRKPWSVVRNEPQTRPPPTPKLRT